jgi:hypothetical protein
MHCTVHGLTIVMIVSRTMTEARGWGGGPPDPADQYIGFANAKNPFMYGYVCACACICDPTHTQCYVTTVYDPVVVGC